MKRTLVEPIIDLCGDEATYPIKFREATFTTTHLDLYPGTGVKFTELVDQRYLVKAVLSSFAVDYQWLLTKVPGDKSVCLIEHWVPSSDTAGNRLVHPNLLVCHPPLKGRQTMHAKLMLLVYPGFLRVVVSSANLVPYDWCQLENVVYVQDFPETKLDTKRPKLALSSSLQADLKLFLSKCEVPSSVLDILESYDFGNSKVELVISVPGSVPGSHSDLGRYSLSKKLLKLIPTLPTATKASLLYQTSSLGSLTQDFIQMFWDTIYPALKGQHPDFKVVFPTRETVAGSLLGTEGGGTIFFNAFNYNSTFPKPILHDAISLRQGSLSHSKIILGQVITSTTSTPFQWIYYGSHNFSGAAWGNKLNKTSQCTINNYELGIIMVDHTYTPPFLNPPPAYTSSDKPWTQPGLGGASLKKK